jgi:hypothetical protein
MKMKIKYAAINKSKSGKTYRIQKCGNPNQHGVTLGETIESGFNTIEGAKQRADYLGYKVF